MRFLTAVLVLALSATPAAASLDAAWRTVPASVPAESLAVRLRALELRPVPRVSAGEAAFALGQFHYARGEYRQASESFLRAAGRLTGSDRADARYWCGLSALALGNAAVARAAFAEAPASRRALAQLGTALAWEKEKRPDKAFDTLRLLLAADAGEATAPALDRHAVLAEQFHRTEEARKSRARLGKEFPGTIEAARLGAVSTALPAAGEVAVQIGAFTDAARARSLADAARRAGFGEASVSERRSADGRNAVWIVRLGRYPNREEARLAGERVQRLVGVGWQVEKP